MATFPGETAGFAFAFCGIDLGWVGYAGPRLLNQRSVPTRTIAQ